MIGAILFELKKILQNKFIWLLIVSFLIIDLYKIYDIKKSLDYPIVGSEKIYNIVKGNVTNDKAEFLINNYDRLSRIVEEDTYSKEGNQEGTYTGYIYGDYSEFGEYYEDYKKIYNYPKEMNKILQVAQDNLDLYKSGDEFEIRKNQKIISDYAGRKIDKYYSTDNMQTYLEYDFSTLLMYILVLAGVSEILFLEKKNKMFFLIETSAKGMKKNMFSKLLSIGIYSLMLVLIVKAVDILWFAAFFDIEGWTQPLYSISDYMYTPFNNSIITYIIFDTVLKYVGVLFWGIVTFFISYIFMDNVRTMAVGMAAFCGAIFLCLNDKAIINPIALFVPTELVKNFEVINILGFPIYYYYIVAILPLIILVVISIILVTSRKSLACRG